MPEFRTYFQEQEKNLTARLQQLIEIESPSQDKPAVDRMGQQVRLWMQNIGAEVQVFQHASSGNSLLGSWNASKPVPPITLLCHMDTVWPQGTLQRRPVRLEGGKLFGPGALDMKAGIVIGLAALRGLHELGLELSAPVQMLCTGDEETGSNESRSIIEETARRSSLVLCLEPAIPGGALKTARKGVGDYLVRVNGRSAHAGADHAKGINAIEAMAHLILELQRLTDYERGTTVNVGTIQGGFASNVVPDSCQIEVDFRVTQLEEAERVRKIVEGLHTPVAGAAIQVSGGLNRPPMVRDEVMIRTFEKARSIAARHSCQLHEGSSGGGSDASFTAPLAPTLDGLGADGDGFHAEHEHVITASLAERAALLAAILSEWHRTG